MCCVTHRSRYHGLRSRATFQMCILHQLSTQLSKYRRSGYTYRETWTKKHNCRKLPASAAYCSPGTYKSKAWEAWSWGKFPAINEDIRVGSLVLRLKAKSYLGWAVLGLSPFPTEQRNRQCVQWGVGQHTLAPLTQGCFSPGKLTQHAQSWLPNKHLAPALVLSCDCFGGKSSP